MSGSVHESNPCAGAQPFRWNYTAPNTNVTSYFNGTCGTPGVKSAGPWCYVEPSTCKNAPIKDTSGLAYDNCATVNSTHTMDTGLLGLLDGLHPIPLSLDFALEGLHGEVHV